MGLATAIGIGMIGGMGAGGWDIDTNAPTSLSLTIISDTRIGLDWEDNSSDETGYSIERSADNITYAEIDTVAADVVTYSDTTCAANTLYYYRVRAFKGSQYSNYTDVASTTTFHSEIGVYITGLTTPLSEGQKILLNNFIGTVKSGMSITSLSDLFDAMYILAGETQESSLKNLVKNAHHCTATNTPDFLAFNGFLGGTDEYLDTNYNPNTEGSKCTQNNCSAGVHSLTDANGLYCDMGIIATHYLAILSRYNNNTIMRLNSGVNPYVNENEGNSLGTFIVTRNAASETGLFGYKDKVSLVIGNEGNTTGVPNGNIFILGRNNGAGVLEQASPRRIAFAFLGGYLSSERVTVITDAFTTYLAESQVLIDYNFVDLHISAQRDDKVLSFNDADTLYLSTDGGDTFPTTLDVTGIGDRIDFAHIFANGNILFATDRKIYLSDDNLATYSEVPVTGIDGNPFVQGTKYNCFRSTGYNIVDIDGSEILVWGNYTNHSSTRYIDVNVWYTVDNGASVKSCYKANTTGTPVDALAAKHIHAVNYDSIGERFIIQTGDGTDECNWISGVYNWGTDTWVWTKIAGDNDGSSTTYGNGTWYKTTGMFFYGGYAYWGSDSSLAARQGIIRVAYADLVDSSKYEVIYKHSETVVSFYAENNYMIGTGLGKKVIVSNTGESFKLFELVGGNDVRAYYNIINRNTDGYFRLDLSEVTEEDASTHRDWTRGQVLLLKIS